jgi:hypothetical protein
MPRTDGTSDLVVGRNHDRDRVARPHLGARRRLLLDHAAGLLHVHPGAAVAEQQALRLDQLLRVGLELADQLHHREAVVLRWYRRLVPGRLWGRRLIFRRRGRRLIFWRRLISRRLLARRRDAGEIDLAENDLSGLERDPVAIA